MYLARVELIEGHAAARILRDDGQPGWPLPSALAVTLRKSFDIDSTAIEGRITRCVSQACWLALVRFRLQYLGWRSTSLGLGELTPGYCGNAFGVKKDDFVC
jgi:hypothetical protein